MQDNINQPTMLASSQSSASNSTKTNKLLPVVVILAILAIAGVGCSIWGIINAKSQREEISDLKSQLVIDDTVKVEEVSGDTNNGSGEVAPAVTLTKADILNSVPENLSLKEHKSLNSDAVRPRLAVNLSGGIEVVCSGNLTDSWLVTIDWDKMNNWYALGNGKTGTERLENVTLGLSGEFTDVYYTGFGQSVGDETIFFLMKDGAVEYIPLRKALKENNFRSYGKLAGVEHVIKFYVAENGGVTALAQRADGDYYNLYNAIQATGNY